MHAKFQPVASHGDPFRDILGPIGPIGPHRAQWALWYQVLGTKCQVLGTKYLVPSTKYLVPSTWYLVPSTWNQATAYRLTACRKLLLTALPLAVKLFKSLPQGAKELKA